MSKTTLQSYDKTAEAYAAMNKVTHAEENGKKFLNLLPKGAKIIDIGCGPGRDAQIFSEKGLHVTGIDFSKEMITLAKTAAPKACFHVMEIAKIDLASESFDGAWASASLLHISKETMPTVLKGIYRILKPGAIFYLSLKQGKGETTEKDHRYGGVEKFWAYYEIDELKKIVSEAGFSVMECSIVEKRRPNQTHPYIDVFCKKKEPMEIVNLGKKFFIGLELRTTNQEGKSGKDIPAHWQRFFTEGVMDKIPGKIGGMVGHYTDYAGDWMQPYTLITGCEVVSLDNIPPGLVGREVPAAKYAVFTVQGKFPDALVQTWQKIWSLETVNGFGFSRFFGSFEPIFDPKNRGEYRQEYIPPDFLVEKRPKESKNSTKAKSVNSLLDLKRAYTSDFEVYPENFDPMGNPEIKIFISIKT